MQNSFEVVQGYLKKINDMRIWIQQNFIEKKIKVIFGIRATK